MRWIWSALVVMACAAPRQEYAYQAPGAPPRKLGPVRAEVVPAGPAEASGLAARTLSVPFEPPADGTQLVGSFLARADTERARYVSELAIYLQTRQEDRQVECRTDIVPETFTETVHHPARHQLVSAMQPVQRTVTDHEYRCRSVTKYESRMHTAYEQQCGSVSKPVQRSRTVYRSSYDSFSKSYRSTPHTEYYTAYESHWECKSQPVTRYRSEPVTKQECGMQPRTHVVTRYEFQLENRYVPARFEYITRQRLRELAPICYLRDDMPPGETPQNRVEGRIFVAN